MGGKQRENHEGVGMGISLALGVVALVLARVLWAFSAWYEVIPLSLALCAFLFVRSKLQRGHDDNRSDI